MRPQAKASREEKAQLGKELPSPIWARAQKAPGTEPPEEGRRKGFWGLEAKGLIVEPQRAQRPGLWPSNLRLQSQVPFSFKTQTPRPSATNSDSKVNGVVRKHLLAI